jgi:uncharacterized protein YndB with AHSA1/START domain
MPSPSPDPNHPIRVQRDFPVGLPRLYRAWHDPDDLAAWSWGSLSHEGRAVVDFRVGGTLRVETVQKGQVMAFSGEYLEIEPDRRVAHTLVWHAVVGYAAVPERLEATFSGDGDSSHVELLHLGVPDEESATGHQRAWQDVLDTLAAHLARPLPS